MFTFQNYHQKNDTDQDPHERLRAANKRRTAIILRLLSSFLAFQRHKSDRRKKILFLTEKPDPTRLAAVLASIQIEPTGTGMNTSPYKSPASLSASKSPPSRKRTKGERKPTPKNRIAPRPNDTRTEAIRTQVDSVVNTTTKTNTNAGEINHDNESDEETDDDNHLFKATKVYKGIEYELHMSHREVDADEEEEEEDEEETNAEETNAEETNAEEKDEGNTDGNDFLVVHARDENFKTYKRKFLWTKVVDIANRTRTNSTTIAQEDNDDQDQDKEEKEEKRVFAAVIPYITFDFAKYDRRKRVIGLSAPTTSLSSRTLDSPTKKSSSSSSSGVPRTTDWRKQDRSSMEQEIQARLAEEARQKTFEIHKRAAMEAIMASADSLHNHLSPEQLEATKAAIEDAKDSDDLGDVLAAVIAGKSSLEIRWSIRTVRRPSTAQANRAAAKSAVASAVIIDAEQKRAACAALDAAENQQEMAAVLEAVISQRSAEELSGLIHVFDDLREERRAAVAERERQREEAAEREHAREERLAMHEAEQDTIKWLKQEAFELEQRQKPLRKLFSLISREYTPCTNTHTNSGEGEKESPSSRVPIPPPPTAQDIQVLSKEAILTSLRGNRTVRGYVREWMKSAPIVCTLLRWTRWETTLVHHTPSRKEGHLDFTEFAQFCVRVQETLTPPTDIQMIHLMLDFDGNGEVDKGRFLVALRSNPQCINMVRESNELREQGVMWLLDVGSWQQEFLSFQTAIAGPPALITMDEWEYFIKVEVNKRKAQRVTSDLLQLVARERAEADERSLDVSRLYFMMAKIADMPPTDPFDLEIEKKKRTLKDRERNRQEYEAERAREKARERENTNSKSKKTNAVDNKPMDSGNEGVGERNRPLTPIEQKALIEIEHDAAMRIQAMLRAALVRKHWQRVVAHMRENELRYLLQEIQREEQLAEINSEWGAEEMEKAVAEVEERERKKEDDHTMPTDTLTRTPKSLEELEALQEQAEEEKAREKEEGRERERESPNDNQSTPRSHSATSSRTDKSELQMFAQRTLDELLLTAELLEQQGISGAPYTEESSRDAWERKRRMNEGPVVNVVLTKTDTQTQHMDNMQQMDGNGMHEITHQDRDIAIEKSVVVHLLETNKEVRAFVGFVPKFNVLLKINHWKQSFMSARSGSHSHDGSHVTLGEFAAFVAREGDAEARRKAISSEMRQMFAAFAEEGLVDNPDRHKVGVISRRELITALRDNKAIISKVRHMVGIQSRPATAKSGVSTSSALVLRDAMHPDAQPSLYLLLKPNWWSRDLLRLRGKDTKSEAIDFEELSAFLARQQMKFEADGPPIEAISFDEREEEAYNDNAADLRKKEIDRDSNYLDLNVDELEFSYSSKQPLAQNDEKNNSITRTVKANLTSSVRRLFDLLPNHQGSTSTVRVVSKDVLLQCVMSLANPNAREEELAIKHIHTQGNYSYAEALDFIQSVPTLAILHGVHRVKLWRREFLELETDNSNSGGDGSVADGAVSAVEMSRFLYAQIQKHMPEALEQIQIQPLGSGSKYKETDMQQKGVQQKKENETTRWQCTVQICDGKDLAKVDRFGLSDPFCHIFYREQKIGQTSTQSDTLTPDFTTDETATASFTINKYSTHETEKGTDANADGNGATQRRLSMLGTDRFEVHVFDAGTLGGKTFMGRISLTSEMLIAKAKKMARNRAKDKKREYFKLLPKSGAAPTDKCNKYVKGFLALHIEVKPEDMEMKNMTKLALNLNESEEEEKKKIRKKKSMIKRRIPPYRGLDTALRRCWELIDLEGKGEISQSAVVSALTNDSTVCNHVKSNENLRAMSSNHVYKWREAFITECLSDPPDAKYAEYWEYRPHMLTWTEFHRFFTSHAKFTPWIPSAVPDSVSVEVTEANGLGKADFLGYSDPYCEVIWCGHSHGATDVKENTCNPEWFDERFDLDWPKGVGLDNNNSVNHTQNDADAIALIVDVWDQDSSGIGACFGSNSTFLGRVSLSRNEVLRYAMHAARRGEKKSFFPLKPRPGDHASRKYVQGMLGLVFRTTEKACDPIRYVFDAVRRGEREKDREQKNGQEVTDSMSPSAKKSVGISKGGGVLWKEEGLTEVGRPPLETVKKISLLNALTNDKALKKYLQESPLVRAMTKSELWADAFEDLNSSTQSPSLSPSPGKVQSSNTVTWNEFDAFFRHSEAMAHARRLFLPEKVVVTVLRCTELSRTDPIAGVCNPFVRLVWGENTVIGQVSKMFNVKISRISSYFI